MRRIFLETRSVRDLHLAEDAGMRRTPGITNMLAQDHGEHFARSRGHRLGPWIIAGNFLRNACVVCQAEVEVRYTEVPGRYHVTGRATKQACPTRRARPESLRA